MIHTYIFWVCVCPKLKQHLLCPNSVLKHRTLAIYPVNAPFLGGSYPCNKIPVYQWLKIDWRSIDFAAVSTVSNYTVHYSVRPPYLFYPGLWVYNFHLAVANMYWHKSLFLTSTFFSFSVSIQHQLHLTHSCIVHSRLKK